MIILTINRRLIKVVFLVAVAISLGFYIYSHIPNSNPESTASAYLLENYRRDAEVFDISRGEVIKRVKINPVIQGEVEEYLGNITGMYIKINAIPKEGYIMRVPLEPPFTVQNRWLNGYGIKSVAEAFVFLPEQGRPFILVLDSQSRPLFFNFSGSVGKLLDTLDFHPEIIA